MAIQRHAAPRPASRAGSGLVVGRLEVEPQTQGFSDRGCGCLWMVPVTCGSRDCKRYACGGCPLPKLIPAGRIFSDLHDACERWWKILLKVLNGPQVRG